MTITPTMALLASFLTPSAMIGGVTYYLNNEYLTVKEFKLTGAEQTIQSLQTQIDDLEDAIQYKTCGTQDRCDAMSRKIKRLKRDLEQWQLKKTNIKEGRQTA